MRTNYSIPLGLLLFSLFLIVNCKSESKNDPKSTEEVAVKDTGIKVLTTSMEFQCADTISSGWNKFIYENRSTEPHFILLDKYPEGKSIIDTEKYVTPPYDEGMALIMEGKNEEAMEAFGKLPEWTAQIVYSGGTGLISPKQTATTHVNLKPGYYIMECYVKMPNGRFHTSMGMTKELIVIDENSGNEPPKADIEITISSDNGIVYEGDMSSGKKVFSVHYIDQIVHENFIGHDINLARHEEDADLDSLAVWMNWAIPKGLMSVTLPEGIIFLGGTNDAPSGTMMYFEVELEPGTYSLISEVQMPKRRGCFRLLRYQIKYSTSAAGFLQ